MAIDTVDEVCEKAFQETLRKLGKLPFPPSQDEPTIFILSETQTSPTTSSSRDLNHEVYLDPTIDYVFDKIQIEPTLSQTSNIEIENVELDDRDILINENSELKEDLNTTKELLLVSENLVRSYLAKIKDFEKLNVLKTLNKFENKNKNICVCENLKIELNHLKVEILSLKTENASLKSACARNFTRRFDVEDLSIGQKPNSKSGLGFKKDFGSKPKLSRPQIQKSKGKPNQPKNSHGHAFIYKDYSRENNFKNKQFSQNKNKRFNYFNKFQKTYENDHFNSCEKRYQRDSNRYFYEISKTNVQMGSQFNESQNRAPKHHTNFKTFSSNPSFQNNASKSKIFQTFGKSNTSNFNDLPKSKIFSAKSTDPKERKAELQFRYHNNFVKSNETISSPKISFCNYC